MNSTQQSAQKKYAKSITAKKHKKTEDTQK